MFYSASVELKFVWLPVVNIETPTKLCSPGISEQTRQYSALTERPSSCACSPPFCSANQRRAIFWPANIVVFCSDTIYKTKCFLQLQLLNVLFFHYTYIEINVRGFSEFLFLCHLTISPSLTLHCVSQVSYDIVPGLFDRWRYFKIIEI